MSPSDGPTILVVDDDPDIRLLIETALDGLGRIVTADGVEAARARLVEKPDVVLVDLEMPGGSGEDVVEALVEGSPLSTVFVVSAVRDVERTVRLMQAGVEDFLLKPIEPLVLRRRVENALVRHRLATQASGRALVAGVDNPALARLQMGPSSAMQDLCRRIVTVADARMTVLIEGETGVGKELVARAVHAASGRAGQPFVTVNCGALPRELIEAELFGHTAGAFTGASGARGGLVKEAAGGTLLLDEVGELPLELQPRLLRFLQEGEVRPVGSDRTFKVDVRVIAATHRNLRDCVDAGEFREDLYFRLRVLPLEVPALRDRPADIPALAEHFLRDAASQAGRTVRGFEKPALRALMSQPWPGNVRELENRVQRAVVFATGPLVTSADLGLDEPSAGGSMPWPEELMDMAFGEARDRVVEEFERAYVTAALLAADGNVSEAARASGLPRKSLWRIAQRVGLAADRASRKAGQLESERGGSDPEDQSADDDAEGILDEVRDGYRKRARATADEIAQRLTGTPSLADWTWVKANAHRLRGSGGSYGLPAVSEIAGALEDAAMTLDLPSSAALAKRLVAAL
jgi:DNA-binding NtrC family response regulator/HPt (histidine-containing phosphotransfer) domain-containing protein